MFNLIINDSVLSTSVPYNILLVSKFLTEFFWWCTEVHGEAVPPSWGCSDPWLCCGKPATLLPSESSYFQRDRNMYGNHQEPNACSCPHPNHHCGFRCTYFVGKCCTKSPCCIHFVFFYIIVNYIRLFVD